MAKYEDGCLSIGRRVAKKEDEWLSKEMGG